jgi:hypothetical protein
MRKLTLSVCVVLCSMFAPGSVLAATPRPAWSIHAVSEPTYISPFLGGHIVLLVTNIGAVATSTETEEGEPLPVTVTDTLPAGLVVKGVSGEGMACSNAISTVTCTSNGALLEDRRGGLQVTIGVAAEPGISGTLEDNTASVSGGGAPGESTHSPVTVSGQDPPFDLENFRFGVTDVEGAPDVRAVGHPNALTVGLDLANRRNPLNAQEDLPVESPKRVTVDLPLGLVGNPQAAEKCPQYALAQSSSGAECPAASVVGSVALEIGGAFFDLSPPFFRETQEAAVSPLFNMVPEHGYPAEFGFDYTGFGVFMYANIAHTDAGYVLRTTVPAITRMAPVTAMQLTFFGDPAVEDGGATAPTAFLRNPADCSRGSGTATIKVNSWLDPGNEITKTAALPAVTGCERLQFEPSLVVLPEKTQIDSPTGVTVDLKVPQNENPNGLATPDLKDATVTLPPGMSISPPSAEGLAGCAATGAAGINLYAEGPVNPDEPEGSQHLLPGSCPQASRIGTVKLTTPLLTSPMEGHVYLAQPGCSTCSEADAEEGRMVGLYLELEGSGVNVKLPGVVEVGGYGQHSVQTGLQPGQLRTRFLDSPQVPFSDLQLTLNGGSHAPLANPPGCGRASTSSQLVPWSAPQTPTATPTSFFDVDWDGAGGACPAVLPFGPGFNAGTITPSAGAFSPFTLTVSRHDRDQDLSGLSVQLPPGLLGKLSQVSLCPEPQASQGTCGAGSLIGHTTVGAGPGPNPFYVNGQVFVTGPYKGAPFGLSVVVPAVAGPFNLGNVVVRAAIHVDPHTAALSVTSDPLPQMLDGVPLQVQAVNVTVDRPGFTFNPTNCAQQQVSGIITAAQGASADVSSPFAVAGCANLPFKPSFKVSTRAGTSKRGGASLDVRVGSGSGYPQGQSQANIAKVAVSLPKQLPSRLTTIQQACLQATFEANPASCPVGSNIGTATARTPVLARSLVGPAYLVSHGGAAFPDLVVVLQGEGVTLDLVGSIDIKRGVTSSTFARVPDAPVSSFELSLPQGPHSALATNLPAKAKGKLCGQVLTMPTTLTGHNGAQVKQATRIAVTGCPKAKKKAKARHKAKAHRKPKKGK